ncbi:MAG: hypothetical protein LYZ69_04940 [Nitrososphaerales archaeon]|nr:hypothetical protein [Nitrososphaerales archaeon]
MFVEDRMPRPVTDDDVKRGMAKLDRLLANPSEFERWANETLDKARKLKR